MRRRICLSGQGSQPCDGVWPTYRRSAASARATAEGRRDKLVSCNALLGGLRDREQPRFV
jgi:hypothetical protein